LLLAVSTAWGLDPHKAISQFVHTVWRSEDGLPQNSIQALLQTSDGYLWMGTQDGLVRFNGIQFAVYTKANVSAFKHNDTRTLFQDADGTLWVGMFGGGLVRYKDGAFTAYTVQNGLSNNFVSSILRDHNGSLWIGTNDGLNEFTGTGFRKFGMLDGLSDNTIQALAEDAQGHLLIGTKRGLDMLGEHRRFVRFSASIPARESILTLLRDQKQDVWVGTENHGLYRFSRNGAADYGRSQGLPLAPISVIYQDATGTIWVGTNGSGMCRSKNEKFDRFDCYGPKDGLSGDNVESIIQDREGTLWVGTETGGVNRFKEGALSNFGSELGIKGSPRTVFEEPDGALWIGTSLGLWHVKDSKAEPYMVKGPLGNYVYSMFQDHEGHVWTGTNEGGLNEFTGHQVKTYTEANGLADNFVPALLVDHAGDVWAGTGGGVSRFHHGKITNYTTKQGLGSNRVWAVQQDHAGDLWFGTDIGLSRLHDGKFTNYNLQEVAAEGSGLGSVMVIYEDAQHAFWIGTYGTGLKLFKDGKFTTISIKEGLFDDTIWSILEDGTGNFWMSSNRGIFRVQKSELIDFAEGKIHSVLSRSYGTSDGMASSECNGGSQYSAWKRKSGELLFACLRSVVVVNPSHLPINTLAPPVVIEKVKINREDGVAPGARIAAGSGELEFHYAALSYFAPEKVAFKCKLEGFEKDWLVPPTQGFAHYTNIPPGSYTFRVIAANNDGIWNDSGASFSFYLEPRFYQTRWFYSFCVLAVLLSAGGIYFLRILRIRRTERELVVLVGKRTHELQSAKELAEAATRAKGDFVANMSHEIRTPLNGVMGMLDLIGQSELTGDQKQLLTMAQDSANSLLVVINDVLDFSKIEAGKLVFDIQEFDLAETIAEAARTMALRAHQKGLELAYQVDPEIPQFLKGDAGRVKQVLTNLLGNAIKFTEKGEVILRASVDKIAGDAIHLHFSVSDTGIGVPPEKQQLIFEAFSQADASTTRKFGGTGLGLAICSRIVELMGGKIWVQQCQLRINVCFHGKAQDRGKLALGAGGNSQRRPGRRLRAYRGRQPDQPFYPRTNALRVGA